MSTKFCEFYFSNYYTLHLIPILAVSYKLMVHESISMVVYF